MAECADVRRNELGVGLLGTLTLTLTLTAFFFRLLAPEEKGEGGRGETPATETRWIVLLSRQPFPLFPITLPSLSHHSSPINHSHTAMAPNNNAQTLSHAALLNLLDAAKHAHTFTFVHGAPAVGKTTLVNKALEGADVFKVVRVDAAVASSSRELSAWAGVLTWV